MKYLKITNRNEIRLEAFTLIGASTKREEDGKIGMFGSGNKYAIAYFVRNGYDLRIFSGKKEFWLTTHDVKFGSKNFSVISVGGRETSITTEMGHKWNLWQAIREFYSNAKDEGDAFFGLVEEAPIGYTGTTSIYIGVTPELEEFMANIDSYFCEDTNFLFRNKVGSILQKTGKIINIFRKGIRCYESDGESLFDYDFNDIDVNESRLVSNTTRIWSKIWKMWGECDSEFLIEKLLNALAFGNISEYNEYAEYWLVDEFRFSKAWYNILENKFVAPRELGGFVDELISDNTYYLPNKLYRKIITDLGKEHDALGGESSGHIKYKIVEKKPLEKDTIKKVLGFFEVCEYSIDYPIEVVEFFVAKEKNNTVMGLANGGKILINREAFAKGLFYVASVVYEESFHLKTGYLDESRAMQNGLIEEMLNYMKQKNGINL